MLESLIIYFRTFIHPWSESSKDRKISYIEVLGISWALHFVYAFYSVFAVFLGVKSYQYFSTSDDFTHLILNSFNFSFQKISLFVQLGMVILYPVVFHFSYRFWTYLLGFYIQIFDSGFDPAEVKVKSEEIVNTMYTSNIFLLLPIAGAVFSTFAQVYYLYRGVVVKLNFTKIQAFLVLLTPLFIIFILAILIVSYLVFLFSLL
jgi:hypothetical protein